MKELNLTALLLRPTKHAEMTRTIEVMHGRLAHLREQQERTNELFEANPSSPSSFVSDKLAQLDQQVTELQAEIKRALDAQSSVKAEAGRIANDAGELASLI